MSAYLQSTGIFTFGNSATPSAVFTSEIMSFQIKIMKGTVTVPATFGNNVEKQLPTVKSREATIEYLGDPSSAASFWTQIYNAIESTTGLLYFTAKFSDAATSSTNKRYVGSLVVTEFTVGAKINEVWQSSVTFPVYDYAEQTA